MTIRFAVFTVLCVIALHVAPAAAVDFPARQKAKYKDLQWMEIETLHREYLEDKVTIVDVRSKLEYETIHIKGAVHISVAERSFDSELQKLISGARDKKTAFYCNGITCLKAYEAQLRAVQKGIKNTFTFDLGIPGWAEQYPEETVLLGKPMSESTVQFIPKSGFLEKCVPWEEFQKMAAQRGVKVIDTRDYVQKGFLSQSDENALSEDEGTHLQKFRTGNKEMLADLSKNGRVMAQSFDMLQRNVIGNKRYRNQTLLIFDQVGKQVRWLMYHFEVAGIKDYYFLSKGANGVIGIQSYGKM